MFTLIAAIILTSLLQAQAYEKHSVEWPTQISETKYKIGPLLHQFQSFSDSYFHEGVDILTTSSQMVYTPVDGTVDAGYYSYKTNSNGQSEKTFISIQNIDENDLEPKLWGERYFEVSITDFKGNRFELHHIKRESLNPALLHAIFAQTPISAGSEIGLVVEWPTKVKGTVYNHIHYSILNSQGDYLNPFWYSKKLQDLSPPKIYSVFAALAKKCSANGLRQLKELSQLTQDDEMTHVVIQTADRLEGNAFPQPPTILIAEFEDGSLFKFDYSTALFTNKLNSYTLDELYVGRFCYGPKNSPFILRGSENFKFYIQFPIPKNFKGKIEISVSDFAENTTKKLIEL